MLRPAVAAFSASSFAQHKTIPSLASRSYAHRTKPPPQNSESEDSATKRWLAVHQGKKEAIPRKIAQIKTSGSASKGGLSGGADTKVTLQIPLNALSNYVSPEMLPGIKGLPCYTHASDQLTIRSAERKEKQQNVDTCYRKVSELLISVGEDVVSRETVARLPGISQKRLAQAIPIANYRKMNDHDRMKYKRAKLDELEKAKKAENLKQKERLLQARRGEK